jgi:hypothetical protein
MADAKVIADSAYRLDPTPSSTMLTEPPDGGALSGVLRRGAAA